MPMYVVLLISHWTVLNCLSLDISALAGTENVLICPVNAVAPGEERGNPIPLETMSSITAPRGRQWCPRLISRKVCCDGIPVLYSIIKS